MRVVIDDMLDAHAFGPEDVKAMTTAYEAVLVELGLTDRADPIAEVVARKIITYCQVDGCDPEAFVRSGLEGHPGLAAFAIAIIALGLFALLSRPRHGSEMTARVHPFEHSADIRPVGWNESQSKHLD